MSRSDRYREGVLGACFLLFAPVFGFAATPHPASVILRTPPSPASPRIHGPKVYGIRPGKPFLYRIPCTGIRPIHFVAKGLPHSLRLNPATGIILGHAPEKPGEYHIRFTASNGKGKFSRDFKIVVGDKIGLTPQMGWNDWYTYYDHITAGDIKTAAQAMIDSGMADYGYEYVSIDDCWANKPGSTDPASNGPVRDSAGAILPNRNFPDMSALTAYIHSMGLKAGIYTSPGPLTCGGYEGSYKHEDQDARQFSKWGFDLLKYDWCSYGRISTGKRLEDYEKPYRKMGSILEKMDRDIVFNICQYGQADVWKWGREVGGNSWRTTGDLGLATDTSLPGFYSVGFSNALHARYAGPGGWNDPDYILIGEVGNAHHIEVPAKPTGLTPDEQYSYMSMWSLMAAPLFFSGDMSKLDPLTLSVLCNSEVIDIDQDSLGKQADIIRKTSSEFILAKQMDDGSTALGLFNLTSEPRTLTIKWQDLRLKGRQNVRDVWRQFNLGTFKDSFATPVPAHGVMLIRLKARHFL